MRRTVATLALGAALLTGACGSGDDPSPAQRSGDGVERDDLDPLVERVPALDGALAAHWYSGTLGSSRVPGPSVYWIDAVVELDPGQAAALRELDLAAVSTGPEVEEALTAHLGADADVLVLQLLGD